MSEDAKHNLCVHCRRIKPCFDIRGWNKCKECIEHIDRAYWRIRNSFVDARRFFEEQGNSEKDN